MPREIISKTWTASQGWYDVTTEYFNIITNHCKEQIVLFSHYISCFIIIYRWASFHVLVWVLLVCRLFFWCVYNKLLLITTSVIHWFYFGCFWTLTTSSYLLLSRCPSMFREWLQFSGLNLQRENCSHLSVLEQYLGHSPEICLKKLCLFFTHASLHFSKIGKHKIWEKLIFIPFS